MLNWPVTVGRVHLGALKYVYQALIQLLVEMRRRL